MFSIGKSSRDGPALQSFRRLLDQAASESEKREILDIYREIVRGSRTVDLELLSAFLAGYDFLELKLRLQGPQMLIDDFDLLAVVEDISEASREALDQVRSALRVGLPWRAKTPEQLASLLLARLEDDGTPVIQRLRADSRARCADLAAPGGGVSEPSRVTA